MTDPIVEIERLVRFEQRGPGTDAERRAANHLRERLVSIGRAARVESTSILPRTDAALVLHVLLVVIGSGLSAKLPLPGAIVAGVATLSALLEITGTARTLSRMLGRRASQNVISEERTLKPGTLILTAHYDAGRNGTWYARVVRFAPYPPLVAAMLIALGCAIARAAGVHSSVALSIAQFVPSVLLLVSVPLLIDRALSLTVPGANDNASGVATVLALAERYGGELEHFDVWVLLPGAGEADHQGMRAWLKRHRSELEPVRTLVISIDEVGAGDLRYLTSEGPLLRYRYHPQLVELCDELRDERHAGASSGTRRATSDALAARVTRIPAITLRGEPAPHHHRPTDTPEHIDAQALERTISFCADLVEAIDASVGPTLPERASQAFTSA